MKVWNNKFILGITGNMASGKSTVAKIFETLGASRISADEIAHIFTNKNSPVEAELISILGKNAQREDGSFDRKKIAEIVFNSPESLHKLNELLHPLIRKKTLEEFEKISSGIIAWEAPLLFEANGEVLCDKVLTVTMDFDKSLKKVRERDNISEEEFKKRLSKQMNIKEKLKRSDFIIENNFSLIELNRECEKIYNSIISLQDKS